MLVFIRFWAQLGTAGYPPRTARRLAVSNVLSLMVAFITSPYIVLYAIYDWNGLFIPIITLAPQIIVYAATPIWNRVGPYAPAIYLLFVWIAFAFLYCWYFGSGSGLQYFFLPGAAASMLVCGVDNLKLSGLVTFISLIGLVIVEQVFTGPASFLTIDPAFITVMFAISVPFAFLLIFMTVLFAFMEAARAEDLLEAEYGRSEMLLSSMLPASIASRLKADPEKPVAETLPEVTILFADIVSFTPRAAKLTPGELMEFLNGIFGALDTLTAEYGLERIKTVGDAYMAAGGLSMRKSGGNHIENALTLAQAMHLKMVGFKLAGEPVQLRIGIHTGPVMAGVIGTGRIAYDTWGDTVNLAARMQETALPGTTQVTAAIVTAADKTRTYTARGKQNVKGYGDVESWLAADTVNQTEDSSTT